MAEKLGSAEKARDWFVSRRQWNGRSRMKLQPSFSTCYQMPELMLQDSPSLMVEQSPEASACLSCLNSYLFRY